MKQESTQKSQISVKPKEQLLHLGFDHNTQRFAIYDQTGDLIHELHCGDCFSIRINLTWTATRIEHCTRRGWILLIDHQWLWADDYLAYHVHLHN